MRGQGTVQVSEMQTNWKKLSAKSWRTGQPAKAGTLNVTFGREFMKTNVPADKIERGKSGPSFVSSSFFPL